jgi:imidazolonepropionase-like amidohydrolase
MRLTVFTLLFISLTAAAFGQTDHRLVFTNVNVLPMNSEIVLTNQSVFIENGVIQFVGDHSDFPDSQNATIIDGTGKFLMPGLAEMHGHVPSLNLPANYPQTYAEDVLFMYVAAGVTTVRGMLGYIGQLELKEKVNSGSWIGPNLYLAGPSFSGASIQSPEQAKNRVIALHDDNWDLLKVHPGLTLEEYTAMAETANELGIPFAGHIPEEVGLENAIRLGQQTIDHLDGYIIFMDGIEEPVSDEMIQKAVQLTVEHDVWVVPTHALWETLIGAADYDSMMQYDELKYMPEPVLNGWRNFVNNTLPNNPYYTSGSAHIHAENRNRLLGALNEAGAKILMGTDAPQLFSVPGFSIHRELPLMKEAGMSNYEILRSGTYNVGLYFSDKDDFGTIETGKRADLILLNSNPLDDLSALKDPAGVMVQGRWYTKSFIDQKLESIEKDYRNRE